MNIHLKNICVATDFSDQSDQALRYGAELAKQNAARLHILHVTPTVDNIALYPSADYYLQMKSIAEEEIRKRASNVEWDGLTIDHAVRSGVPYDQICRYADDFQIDMMIVGTHGRSGIAHFLLGSVAERVVRHCPCPVLTVRLKKAAEPVVQVGLPETASEPQHHAHLHFANHSASSTGFVAPEDRA